MSACPCNLPPQPDDLIDDLKRLISDNHTILGVYVILLIFFGLGLAYVIKDMLNIVMEFIKNRVASNGTGKSNDNTTNGDKNQKDDEFYPEPDENGKVQAAPSLDNKKPKDYREDTEQEFYNNVKKKYSSYNAQKTDYIARQYDGQPNDDIIDDNIEYSIYDDYDYSTKPNKINEDDLMD
jgi:hypothetical protein